MKFTLDKIVCVKRSLLADGEKEMPHLFRVMTGTTEKCHYCGLEKKVPKTTKNKSKGVVRCP